MILRTIDLLLWQRPSPSCWNITFCPESAPLVGCTATYDCLCLLVILFLPGIFSMCFSSVAGCSQSSYYYVTTLALIFHILCIPNLRSWDFSISSLSLSTMCVSFGIAIYILSLSFVCLSITTKSGLQACICLSQTT